MTSAKQPSVDPPFGAAGALADAEDRFLQAQRADPDSPYYCGFEPRRQRRKFLLGASAALGGAIAGGGALAAAPPGAVQRQVPDDATKVQGEATGADGGYGSRSQFETEVRERFKTATPESSWTLTPLASGMGIVTPSGLHFERHHGGIPTIDPAKHTLVVHGMVERARNYSMHDVKRFPALSRIFFIECSGNGLTEWTKPTMKMCRARTA